MLVAIAHLIVFVSGVLPTPDVLPSCAQSERCAAIRARSAKMEQLCQLRESNREEGTLC